MTETPLRDVPVIAVKKSLRLYMRVFQTARWFETANGAANVSRFATSATAVWITLDQHIRDDVIEVGVAQIRIVGAEFQGAASAWAMLI